MNTVLDLPLAVQEFIKVYFKYKTNFKLYSLGEVMISGYNKTPREHYICTNSSLQCCISVPKLNIKLVVLYNKNKETLLLMRIGSKNNIITFDPTRTNVYGSNTFLMINSTEDDPDELIMNAALQESFNDYTGDIQFLKDSTVLYIELKNILQNILHEEQ